MNTSHDAAQDGSLPMALLVAIVLGGIVVALFGIVSSGVESARRDRDFHQAVQVADAGIQEAYVVLATVQPGDDPPCDDTGDGACTGTLDDGETYTWRYDRVGEFLWDVRSVGESGGVQRAIHARIGQTPLYEVGILTKKYFDYNGGGTGTDKFAVGTFEDAIIVGSPAIASISGIMLYGEGPHKVNVPPTTIPQETGQGPATPNIAQDAFEEDGICADEPFYASYPANVPSPHVRGQIYCVGTVDFSNDKHVLTGPEDLGVTIFVDPYGASAVSIKGSGEANWAGARDASQLQIYAAAGSVTISGSSKFAGAVWAPNSACTSNGGTSIAGAMVCNSATLNGNFGYDASVESIIGTEFAIDGWREETVSG